MKALWTFEDQEKLDKFIPIMKNSEIVYEINSKRGERGANQLTICKRCHPPI